MNLISFFINTKSWGWNQDCVLLGRVLVSCSRCWGQNRVWIRCWCNNITSRAVWEATALQRQRLESFSTHLKVRNTVTVRTDVFKSCRLGCGPVCLDRTGGCWRCPEAWRTSPKGPFTQHPLSGISKGQEENNCFPLFVFFSRNCI